MTTLKTSILLDFKSLLTTALDLGGASSPASLVKSFGWTDGAAINQANRVWTDRRTLAASGTENLDLAAVLLDAFGTAITFARVRALIVAAASTNTNNVLVGGAASNGFVNWVSDATDVVVVRPGGLLALVAPDATAYAVTAATGDILKVTNSAGTTGVTYDIAIVGAAT
jgi:hypothetical protein